MNRPSLVLTIVLAAAAQCSASGSGKVNMAYYLGSDPTPRNYFAKDIATSGAASQITHILYAFATPTLTGCKLTDPKSDYGRLFDAVSSVDGVADDPNAPASTPHGNFGQLLKLKAAYPNLKILVSLGGWLLSDKFSAAASTAASRQAFASNCIGMFIQGKLENGMSIAGLFDGIDIDWEYPVACGNTCAGSPADTENFTLLLAEFRRQLDALGKHYLLTVALPASRPKYALVQLNKIHRSLDYLNLMTYDIHGAWEPATNHAAPLFANPAGKSENQAECGDQAVRDYLAAGVPAEKIVLGVPFYGRGWKGVPETNHGLFQKAAGAAPSGMEAGVESYRTLKTQGHPGFSDAVSRAFWTYDAKSGIFWSYDDPAALKAKTEYVKQKGLAGVMSWELSNDDTSSTLIRTLADGLK